jgi:hypothetical protein
MMLPTSGVLDAEGVTPLDGVFWSLLDDVSTVAGYPGNPPADAG